MTGSGARGNRLHKDRDTHHDPLYPSPNTPGASGYNDTAVNRDPYMNDDQFAQQGYGVGGTATGGAARHGVAPQTDATGNPAHPRTTGSGGAGSRFAGKVESAVGTMLGSESLKRKGMEKEQ